MKNKSSNLRALFAVSLAIGLFFVLNIANNTISPVHADELDNILLEQPKPLPEFELIDHFLKPFNRDQLLGKWTFVFFGYTNCPDVCPVTLMEMDKLIDVLKPNPPHIDQFQYIFVSVDPDRDTPQHLAEYVKYFNASILGVTGSINELSTLAKSVKIKFSKAEGTKDEYGVNHSSALLLIDPGARYFARFRAPHDVDKIYRQFRQLAQRVNSDIKKTDTKTQESNPNP